MAFSLPPIEFISVKELKNIIHTLGKRAMSRIKSLAKAFAPGGSQYGKKSYILDRYGDFNTKVKGKSKKALALQAQQALDILNAKSSTIKGIREMENKRMETFKKHHPGLGDIDKDKYQRAMSILGRIQSAEKGAQYDSDEQLAMAYNMADMKKQDIDAVIDDIINRETSSSDYFQTLDFDEQRDFITLGDDDVQDYGDQENEETTVNRQEKKKVQQKGSEKKKYTRKKK